MNLPKQRLPRLVPPPVRRRAAETAATVAAAAGRARELDALLRALGAGDEVARTDPSEWDRIRAPFADLALLADSVGQTEMGIWAGEGLWLSTLACETPGAGDADAIEFCLDRTERILRQLERGWEGAVVPGGDPLGLRT